MTACRKYESKQGFLLLEMLIVLSVVSVMAALMSRFMGQIGSITRLEATIVAQTELDAAAAYLRRTVEAARPLRLLDAEANTNPLFDGRADSLRFAAVTRTGIYSLALRDVRIFLASGNGRRSLVHSLAPRRLANGKPVAATAIIPVLENIQSLTVEYNNSGVWTSSFSKDGELPSAVRFILTRDMGGKTISSSAIARIFSS